MYVQVTLAKLASHASLAVTPCLLGEVITLPDKALQFHLNAKKKNAQHEKLVFHNLRLQKFLAIR